MPIWDVNRAGTHSEIGKIWDVNRAGTHNEIGKIRDVNRAGVDTEVWSAETQIYPGARVEVELDYMTSGEYGDFWTEMYTDKGNSSSAQPYITIDLSEFKTLEVDCYLWAVGTRGSHAGMYIHTRAHSPYYIFRDNDNPECWTRKASVYTGSTHDGVFIWDVSDLNGPYNLYAACYLESELRANMRAEIRSVVGYP